LSTISFFSIQLDISIDLSLAIDFSYFIVKDSRSGLSFN